MTFWIVSLGIMKQLKFKDIKDNTRNWKIFARFMLKGLGSDVIMVLSRSSVDLVSSPLEAWWLVCNSTS